MAFGRGPGCSMVPAEGVRCAPAANDCETCGRVRGVLNRLRAELRAA
ncbi:MAG: hypothetical protein MUF10_00875 [Thermoanaerobaculaceae bacterium]|nr:hypothetical protein [Thermoanaerobaculaceae bacterium]